MTTALAPVIATSVARQRKSPQKRRKTKMIKFIFGVLVGVIATIDVAIIMALDDED